MKISSLILLLIIFFFVYACSEKKNNYTNAVVSDIDSSYSITKKSIIDSLKAISDRKESIKEDDSVISKLLAFNNKVRFDSIHKVDYINKYPKDFVGIGYYITYDTTKLSSYKQIFITDDAFYNNSIALLRINDKEIYLQHDSINSKSRIKDIIQEAWTGHGINVVLKCNVFSETGDEMKCNGTLEIKSKKNFFKIKIHGGWSD